MTKLVIGIMFMPVKVFLKTINKEYLYYLFFIVQCYLSKILAI